MELNDFLGTWEEASKEGFDDFAAAIGLGQQKTDFYKNSKTVITYARDGDKWTIDVGIVGHEKNGRRFEFKMGEVYPSANLDGTPMQSCIVCKDNKFFETHKIEEMENEMQITREVAADKKTMLVTTQYTGHVMTSTYKKA